jgi:hypothetical protein
MELQRQPEFRERKRPVEPVITIVLKATTQKVEHPLFCLNCGRIIGSISDRVLMTFDGITPLENYTPNEFGFINVRCKNCKQDYRIEVAKEKEAKNA